VKYQIQAWQSGLICEEYGLTGRHVISQAALLFGSVVITKDSVPYQQGMNLFPVLLIRFGKKQSLA
jgi:hypothetical protein